MPESREKRRPSTPKHREDRAEGKCFPNGIAATIRAIQQFWPNTIDNNAAAPMGADDFLATFRDKYLEVTDLYPGIDKKSKEVGSIRGMILDLGRGEGNVSFYQLRAFASYVGLPTGLFLLFGQLVSDERREIANGRNPRGKARRLIDGIRRIVDATEMHLNSLDADDPVFTLFFDESNEKYLADCQVLKIWTDAFRECEYDRADEPAEG